MTQPGHYGTLRAVLLVLAIFWTLGGIASLFATSWILSLIHSPAVAAAPLLFAWVFKALGILALAIAYPVYQASKDPVRYVAVIDALAAIAAGLALVEIYGLYALNIGALYAPSLIWTQAIFRLALAAVLIALRPRGSAKEAM